MLMESIGLYTCDALLCGYSFSYFMKVAKKILGEAKKKDCKLITGFLYQRSLINIAIGGFLTSMSSYLLR